MSLIFYKIRTYAELMKPELTGLSVLTTLCSFYLASSENVDFFRLVMVCAGTLLVGGGAGALNEYWEWELDSMMRRTERRPIPSGRVSPLSGLVFGAVCALLGLAILAVFNNALALIFAAITLASYVLIYTPLKRVTRWNTIVGAIPGALPTLIGWAAARNELNSASWVLFAILFTWQIPHFLALAWMYKKDYARAGFKMLPVVDDYGKRTSQWILFSTAALFFVILLVPLVGLAGKTYWAGSIPLSAAFLVYAFLLDASAGKPDQAMKVNAYSRKIFFSSLLYLPALMVMMTVDKV